MLNEIEELEKKLRGRSPAQTEFDTPEGYDVSKAEAEAKASGKKVKFADVTKIGFTDEIEAPADTNLTYAPQKKIFNSMYEDVKKPNAHLASGLTSYGEAGGQSVVGGKPADYSGYEDLMKKLEGLKPKDTSTQDLIAMGLSTGLGALFGKVGAGAKVAGEYGLERAAKHEKREETVEDMILKLQAARAAKMATTVKGTKVGSAGAGSTEARKWEDEEGNIRLSMYKDENGLPARSASDPILKSGALSAKDLKKSDGGVEQVFTKGNLAVNVGRQNPTTQLVTNAKGEKEVFNSRVPQLSDGFNKTAMDLTPDSKKSFEKIQSKKMSDPSLKAAEQIDSTARSALTALNHGDPLSTVQAVKNLATILEGGYRTSDKDYSAVAGVNMGLMNKIEGSIKRLADGSITDTGRREVELVLANIMRNNRELHGKKIANYNLDLKKNLGAEHRPDLEWKGLGDFTGKDQEAASVKNYNKAADLSSGSVIEREVFDSKGNKVRKKFRYNPASKKWVMKED